MYNLLHLFAVVLITDILYYFNFRYTIYINVEL